MKEVLNIRIDKDILDQIKNFQIMKGIQSGFVPSRTAVIEKLIVKGLLEYTDDYEFQTRTPQGAEIDEQADAFLYNDGIHQFAKAWLNKSLADPEE